MNYKNNKKIILYITLLVVITLTLLGLTYAYYRTRVIGNTNDKSVSIKAKKLEVVYNDGNGELEVSKVKPGYTNEMTPKTFTVTNTGTGEASYVLYIEDVINGFVNGTEERGEYNDWTYKVTCSPNCNGTEDWIDFPKLSEMIAENTIAKGETQTYSVFLKYADSDEDQSADMGESLKGKFQIYSPEEVVDIEGTIANYEEGDYVQINSIEKKSQIVDGKYRLSAVEIGEHTLKVMSKNATQKGSTKIIVEKGISAGTNENKITIDDNSKTAFLNITNITTNLGINLEIKLNSVDNQTSTLLYDAIFRDNEISEPLSEIKKPALENEAILASTDDDLGTTYYFRGNVQNNYVTYSNMCWRIVRVLGNGDIKITLADGKHPCGTDNGYSINNNTSAFVTDTSQSFWYSTTYDTTGSVFVYSNSLVAEVLKAWSGLGNNRTYYHWYDDVTTEDKFTNEILDITKLTKTPTWCIDTKSQGPERDPFTGEIYDNIKYYRQSTSLNCNEKDKYTGSAIAILSDDEVLYAGSTKSYLKTNANNAYWTLSPYLIDYNGVGACVTQVLSNGSLDSSVSYLVYGISIRPAVVLKSDVTLGITNYKQDGTVDRPYVID